MKKAICTFVFALSGLLFYGCKNTDSGTNSRPSVVTVQFVYLASTVLDPRVASQFPLCVQAVGRTHLHPGWQNFSARDMTAVGTARWELTYNDVPANAEHTFRINDPNGCSVDPNGAVIDNIFANGVRLTRVVSTPGNGPERGLAFRVSDRGIVTP